MQNKHLSCFSIDKDISSRVSAHSSECDEHRSRCFFKAWVIQYQVEMREVQDAFWCAILEGRREGGGGME